MDKIVKKNILKSHQKAYIILNNIKILKIAKSVTKQYLERKKMANSKDVVE